ncbi:30S ribosome-binding factor RbfA [Candidatus Parcubacteria bacterium]|nr:MAG: 30S ribosome-binding factor RbfA [Candidatus Parcubacteria bacterium]
MGERILKINKQLHHEVGKLLLSEIEFPASCFVTVVKVSTSPDLKHSKIFLSVLPEKLTGTVLKVLEKNKFRLQGQLNRKLKIRPLPRLSFRIDRTEAEATDIEELLDRIKKKK